MERQKFEDEFRDAFQNATAEPSEKVWTNIELDLERQESGKMKRRLLTFKWLAAASVIFAMGVGATTWYMLSQADRSSLLANQEQSVARPTDDVIENNADESAESSTANSSDRDAANTVKRDETFLSEKASESNSRSSATDATVGSSSAQPTNADRPSVIDGTVRGHSDTQTAQAVSVEAHDTDGNNAATSGPLSLANSGPTQSRKSGVERTLPPIVRRRPIQLTFPKTEPDAYDLLLARLEMEQREEEKESRFNNEKIWTSVGVAAGSFSSVSPGVNSPSLMLSSADAMQAFSNANRSLSNETRASGVSYSVGVSVGTKIAKRWVLQGGLNYLSQSSDYTSDAVVTEDFRNFSAATSVEYNKIQQSSSSARVIPTAPYDVNNNLQFLSFPVQAGYLVLNRDFAIQLNGGIATDVFIQNTITPQSGDLSSVTNGRGADSPYRPLNFSGLVGSEFSYRFADRYRLSVNPGIRYPFNSVYKESLGLDATQVSFDVGLRFRYIFK